MVGQVKMVGQDGGTSKNGGTGWWDK
jgi:hypothetical protein